MAGGRVPARQDGRLTRSALRSPFDSETRISSDEPPLKNNLRLFILKHGERRGILQSVERIVRSTRADSQAINEEEKNGHARG